MIHSEKKYLDDLKEAMFISKNPLVYKLDKWEKSIDGKLFVAGAVGSGKSTYSTELSKKYNCKVIELDILIHKIGVESGVDDMKLDRKQRGLLYQSWMNKMFYDILEIKEKLICEGIQTFWVPRKELFEKCSVILIRISNTTSMWRAFMRSIRKRNLPLWFSLKEAWITRKFWKDLNEFEDDLQNEIAKLGDKR